MRTGFFLLDKPNRYGRHFYAARQRPILACVVHITAGLQGRPTGADSSAERTSLYAATTSRRVSWHSGSDRDSHLQLLPDSYTAFHCQGYNSCTIGHEISKTDVRWSDEDPLWVEQTLRQAAACLAPRVKALGIPLRRATKAELDHALRTGSTRPVGFIDHSLLDPGRRSDPGFDFPWTRFFALLTEALGGAPALDLSEEDDSTMRLIRNNTEGSPLFGRVALIGGPNGMFEHVLDGERAKVLARVVGLREVNAREFDVAAAFFQPRSLRRLPSRLTSKLRHAA